VKTMGNKTGGRGVGRDVANSTRRKKDCSREEELGLVYMQPGPTWIVSFQASPLSPFPEVCSEIISVCRGKTDLSSVC
jgi:hypothetical protein